MTTYESSDGVLIRTTSTSPLSWTEPGPGPYSDDDVADELSVLNETSLQLSLSLKDDEVVCDELCKVKSSSDRKTVQERVAELEEGGSSDGGGSATLSDWTELNGDIEDGIWSASLLWNWQEELVDNAVIVSSNPQDSVKGWGWQEK
ncbi:hypothetical protein TrVE_jg5410 [Triparma verrucosa]|uniref:Uncharacterized protein n=1 Tax=Triparma verrucosa TaxID=1606542 RepID=A0A9W7KV74_9STRA|nr:hypothetical protein TrVE_jg5410 [Triparma verrucosa]